MTGPTHNHTQQSPTDESYWIDGCVIEHGRCDTCGAPCDEQGCTRDRTHEVTRNSTDSAAPEPVQSQVDANGHDIDADHSADDCPQGVALTQEQVVYRITRADVEARAGRALTDDEIARVEKALEWSDIESVVEDVVTAATRQEAT